MAYKIDAKDFNDNSCIVNIDLSAPDYCPICHKHVDPQHLLSQLSGVGDSSSRLQRVYKCTNRKCGGVFIAIYRGVPQGGHGARCWYFYKNVEPGYPQNPIIPEKVSKISQNFAEIYTQAKYAEDYGLTQICGVGYRKSLEFLEKDYLLTKIDQLPIDKKVLVETPLYACIQNYIEDEVTKEVAKRAVWLGNDETHYCRKWEDKDIKDLKTLLNLTINSIENKLVAQEYIAAME